MLRFGKRGGIWASLNWCFSPSPLQFLSSKPKDELQCAPLVRDMAYPRDSKMQSSEGLLRIHFENRTSELCVGRQEDGGGGGLW